MLVYLKKSDQFISAKVSRQCQRHYTSITGAVGKQKKNTTAVNVGKTDIEVVRGELANQKVSSLIQVRFENLLIARKDK